jgi:hypothetical protein
MASAISAIFLDTVLSISFSDTFNAPVPASVYLLIIPAFIAFWAVSRNLAEFLNLPPIPKPFDNSAILANSAAFPSLVAADNPPVK